MPLSRAEIQRRYRERKKAESESFLKKDRERKRKAYVPVAMLKQEEVKKRRKETLKRVKKHYQEKKKKDMPDDSAPINKQPHTRHNKGSSKLTVALDFKKNPKLTHNSKTKYLKNKVSCLTLKNEKLLRTKKTLQRRIQRLNKGSNERITKPYTMEDETLTPKSKTDKEMRIAKLSPRKYKDIKKRLLFLNVLEKEVKEKGVQVKLVGLNIAKKYKQVKAYGKVVGKDRRSLSRKQSTKAANTFKIKVNAFYEREDNAVTMPGKKDTATKEKVQKKILTDYLHNLHAKFLLENTDTKISRSRFSLMRPKHIMPVNFSSRNTCLCSRHQNISLKLKAVQDIFSTKNPDEFIKRYDDKAIEEHLNGMERKEVIFTEWKKLEENGKMRWKQVQTNMLKEEFSTMFTTDIVNFRQHVDRVKNQYSQMRKLRENLEDGHVLVWMDFAENFTCTALDEVQSAYWTSNQVTLHTTVTYFPKSVEKSHQSFVGIPEVNMHNTEMVVAMISEMVPMLKTEYPDITCVHYLTDSPTSQYRNKGIFKFITEHSTMFGINARWDYLEAGHGKGPCDGLGGSVKRSADMAIKQGKAVIQNASDFYNWTQNVVETETSVKYYYVDKQRFQSAADDVNTLKTGVKAIPGTLKIHSVVPVGPNKVATREISCNCHLCLLSPENSSCAGWTLHELKNKSKDDVEDANDTTNSENNAIVSTALTNVLVLDEGDFCAAVFEEEWYIGVVTEKREAEMKINFMEEVGKLGDSFKWPVKRDEVWIPVKDIMMKIPNPIPSGRSKRIYKLGLEIIDMIESVFEGKV